MDSRLYDTYVQILREELKPAMGCTEPIAVAYAGALARKALGRLPRQVRLSVSGNIIKNVKSVVVPHTGGLRGIAAAASAGIVAGKGEAELEVISSVTPEQIGEIAAFASSLPNVDEIHLLPYHSMGRDKYAGLGREYLMGDIKSPTKEHMQRLVEKAESYGLKAFVGG